VRAEASRAAVLLGGPMAAMVSDCDEDCICDAPGAGIAEGKGDQRVGATTPGGGE